MRALLMIGLLATSSQAALMEGYDPVVTCQGNHANIQFQVSDQHFFKLVGYLEEHPQLPFQAKTPKGEIIQGLVSKVSIQGSQDHISLQGILPKCLEQPLKVEVELRG